MKKIKKLIYAFAVLLIFTACTKERLNNEVFIDETNQDNLQRLNDLIPSDIKVITLNEWKERGNKKRKNSIDDKFIIATENEKDFADKDLLRKIITEAPIAYIGNASSDQISEFTGASLDEKSLFISYIDPEKGKTTTIFPVNPEENFQSKPTKEENKAFNNFVIDYAKNELHLTPNDLDLLKLDLINSKNHNDSNEITSKHDRVTSKAEDFGYINTEINNIYTKIFQGKTNIISKSAPSLSDYAYQTIIKYSTKSDYKYKHIFKLARGRKNGAPSSDERFFVETIHEAGVGVQSLARLSSVTSRRYGLGCMLRQYIYDVLHKIELESYAEKDMYLETYSPSNGGGDGGASYSGSQSFGLKLKALNPIDTFELAYNFGHSYSYSLPDIRFYVNHTASNARHFEHNKFRFAQGNAQKMNFTFNLEKAKNGDFGDFGAGITKNTPLLSQDDLFIEKGDWPLFLRSAMRIDTNVIYSIPTSRLRTYDSRKKWFYISANLHKFEWLSAEAWRVFCGISTPPGPHEKKDETLNYFNGMRLNLNVLL